MVVFQLSEVFFIIFNRYCFLVFIITMIVFTFIDHIVNSSIKLKYQHCDARQIQEYYMNNLRYKKKEIL